MILNKQLSSEDNKVAEQIEAQMSSGLLQHENKSVIAPLELARRMLAGACNTTILITLAARYLSRETSIKIKSLCHQHSSIKQTSDPLESAF